MRVLCAANREAGERSWHGRNGGLCKRSMCGDDTGVGMRSADHQGGIPSAS